MNAESRRREILQILTDSNNPVSAGALAKRFGVSRQVIVGDVALLRAGGSAIIATPRGYLLQNTRRGITHQIACIHRPDEMRAELDAIVDRGCEVTDVIVEHPVYGQIVGMLQLATREDVDQFIKRCSAARPLSCLTGGLHLHTITCPSEAAYESVKTELDRLGFLLKK